MLKASGLAARRLISQQIARPSYVTPGDLVAWMGAVQAQDYGAAKWAVGLRLAGAATDASVERAIDDGSVLRTHALRGTWQRRLLGSRGQRFHRERVRTPIEALEFQ